jgi:hypothetical protein
LSLARHKGQADRTLECLTCLENAEFSTSKKLLFHSQAEFFCMYVTVLYLQYFKLNSI